jgi:hypothetical protein
MYGYSGALESTGFDEPGIGGAKLIVVKYKDGNMAMDAKNLSFGKIVFKKEIVDITGVDSGSEVVSRVNKRNRAPLARSVKITTTSDNVYYVRFGVKQKKRLSSSVTKGCLRIAKLAVLTV